MDIIQSIISMPIASAFLLYLQDCNVYAPLCLMTGYAVAVAVVAGWILGLQTSLLSSI